MIASVTPKRIEREVADLAACDFYHTIDLPDGTVLEGHWDLRQTAGQYLGDVDFAGKRVIEIGPASGFLSFHMERKGARVVAVEPPMDSFWDLVPRAGAQAARDKQDFFRHIERVRNSFWYLHRAFESKVELYEADAYRLPPSLGAFDVAVLASVLLHCSSPVQLMNSVAALGVKEMIVSEVYNPSFFNEPVCRLIPSPGNSTVDTWWGFSPAFFSRYFEVLGFRKVTVTRHRQYYGRSRRFVKMFTVVGSDRQS